MNKRSNKLNSQSVTSSVVGPLLPDTSRSLPIALTRAREKVMLPIRKMLAASGITEQQWRILRVLYEQGPMDSSTLAEQACLLLPSLTRIVQSMQEKKLVTRTVHKDDRRRQSVAITKKGRSVIDTNLLEAASIAVRFEQVLGKKKFNDLLDSLRRLDDL